LLSPSCASVVDWHLCCDAKDDALGRAFIAFATALRPFPPEETTMRVSLKLFRAAGLGAVLLSMVGPTMAADVAGFYKGRELDVVIGSTPGA
jgi:hypothetical protein